MAGILLITSDQRLGTELTQQLSQRRDSVTVFARESENINVNAALLLDTSVVILDMTENSSLNWKTLDQITQLALSASPGPRILCLSKVYRGPRMELEIERKGARLVYVR